MPFSTEQNTARLFPLGGLVFFPGARLPLRIFEPRYRQMTGDALASDRRIVMVLPAAKGANEPVPIHSVGTLGRIRNERLMPNGEFLLELIGEKRVRIVSEVPTLKLYREARIEPIEDRCPPHFHTRFELQRAEILRHLKVILPEGNASVHDYLAFLSHGCGPSVFSDIVTFSAPLPVEFKQQQLEEPRVDRRLANLIQVAHEKLGEMVSKQPSDFPPVPSRS